MSSKIVGALLAAMLGACQASTPPSADGLLGVWGGQHVRLDLTATGGALEYDCATGSIDEPVRPDQSGAFSARGTHSPSHGGPARIGETPSRLPATYSGRISGARMRLTVRVNSANPDLGPFELKRGADATLMRCL